MHAIQEGYWGSAVLDESNDYRYDLFLHPCPPGYCKCSQNTSLGSTSCGFTYTNSDPDAQCVDERKGREYYSLAIQYSYRHYKLSVYIHSSYIAKCLYKIRWSLMILK